VTSTGWRLVPARHAKTALDGEGARLHGGCWNSAGVPLVYASAHQSLAVLELRVHIDATSMSTPYKWIAFDFDEALMRPFPVQHLPKDWRREPPPASLQRLGDAWVKAGDSVILAVPSVIVPHELNLLLNPRHPDISKIHIRASADFTFDRRLFH
jgi:RES domain-containing protein